MNVVLIVPTGIGCEIGGHAGDANPVAKLIGKCCDRLITHPNVVNASDINEMSENTLYVEGSIMNRFLRGEIWLKEVHYNKILLAVNHPIDTNTVNAVHAAESTIGADITLVGLDTELKMTGYYDKQGKAAGTVEGALELWDQISRYSFDALAIQTAIDVDRETALKYLSGTGGVNPWGGIEAIASKLIAKMTNTPVAHAPFEISPLDFKQVVDPRMAAEMVSTCYLHCILKGLHKAPRISSHGGLSVDDIDFMISPINCVGEPHRACMENKIPVIAVRENENVLNDPMPDEFIIVDNYLEAAGLLMSYKAGVSKQSVRRFIK